jgi:3-oxoadipate enol-lactonase
MAALIDRRPPPLQSPSRFFAAGAFERRPELRQIFERPRPAPDIERQRRRALALESFDSLGRLAEVRAPTQVIGALGDQVIPPASSCALAERIPGARLIMLEGVGHALTWEAPERVALLIRDFFVEA